MRQSIKGHNSKGWDQITKSSRTYMQIILDDLNKGSEISVRDAERLIPMLDNSAIRRICVHLETVRGIPIDMIHKRVDSKLYSFWMLGLEVDA